MHIHFTLLYSNYLNKNDYKLKMYDDKIFLPTSTFIFTVIVGILKR